MSLSFSKDNVGDFQAIPHEHVRIKILLPTVPTKSHPRQYRVVVRVHGIVTDSRAGLETMQAAVEYATGWWNTYKDSFHAAEN